MRFNDIITEVTRPQTRVTADAVLRHAGYERLGNGAFGAVYEKPGAPYVLKVFSGTDEAYRAFLGLVAANQDNPHFPRIKGKAVPVTPLVSAVRMERLAPYRGEPYLIDTYLRRRDFAGRDPMRWADVMELMEEYPKLQDACDLIIDNLLTKYDLDIRQDNFMSRDGTIVITDPVKNDDYVKQEKLPSVPMKAPEPLRRAPKWGPEDDAILDQLLAN